MFELSLIGVKKYMDATLVLKNISFQVYSGEKVGIVGVNGSGKSTILKLIAGIEPMNYYPGYPQTSSYGYDEGFISLPREATCAYLEQIPQYDNDLTVIEVLKLAFEEVYSIENKMRELEEKMKFLQDNDLEKALKQYSDLVALYEVKGGYSTEEKLSKICTGLKFDESFLNKKFNLLSGGEKTTVVLGKLLMDNPDILLLDEPTNHLDMESIEWLENYLNSYNGIVIIVSHDRYFLDNIVTKIVEIEDMESITYKGNYSSYVSQKEENMRIQYEHFREQQKKINSIPEGKAREYLSKFTFYGNSVFKKVKHLSGGERIRLKLGKLLYEDINLLILDEPTNHLDIDSIETFEEALGEFKGTIFFISHDRYFINKIGERVIAVEDKCFRSYAGNYDYYKNIKDEMNFRVIEEPVVKVKKVRKPSTVDESKKKETEKAKFENKLYSKREEVSKELDEIVELWLSFNS